MNKEKLMNVATSLEHCLAQHASENEQVAYLQKELRDLIGKSKAKLIDTPLDWHSIPGGRLFTEQGLSQFPELESAYSIFKVEITGGIDDRTLKVINDI